jgi:primosomal protein N' (replication factor Y) (superfamily II helicase)
MRQMLRYPPFGAMVRLVIRGPVEPPTAEFAGHLATQVREALAAAQTEARVLGPAPAPFARLRGKYRFQIQLQGADGEQLRAAVRTVTAAVKTPEEIQWIVDVDPMDML